MALPACSWLTGLAVGKANKSFWQAYSDACMYTKKKLSSLTAPSKPMRLLVYCIFRVLKV
jgi:hypothetical protein